MKLYDIYGGRGVDGSPILVKEEKERKSGDLKNGEECNRNVLNNLLKTPKQARSFVLDRQDKSYQVCEFIFQTRSLKNHFIKSIQP